MLSSFTLFLRPIRESIELKRKVQSSFPNILSTSGGNTGTFRGSYCLSIQKFFVNFEHIWEGVEYTLVVTGGGLVAQCQRAGELAMLNWADGTGVRPFTRPILMLILSYRATPESHRNSAA